VNAQTDFPILLSIETPDDLQAAWVRLLEIFSAVMYVPTAPVMADKKNKHISTE